MERDFQLFPEQASSVAGQVDALLLFLVLVSGFFTLLICVLILFFAVRYRRGAAVSRANPPASMALEIGWSVVPFALSIVMFIWGGVLYFKMFEPQPDADEIYVVGKQWMWKIRHSSGRREINQLHLPVGRPVKLRMISEDVIHSFYIPAFRMKTDVLPGRYTEMSFVPTKVGTYHLFCAEYCGTSHSQMGGQVVVLSPADFAAWLAGQTAGEPPELSGQQLFAQYRCNTCHLQPGESGRGPPLQGLYQSTVRLADGSTVTADDNYIRESILEPNAQVAAGYQPVMPTYEGQIDEEGILQLIAYIKGLVPSK